MKTDTVAVFSDDVCNLKSGYPNEGQPAFITGGKPFNEAAQKMNQDSA